MSGGIVRKMDELGRVVIPIEIRRVLNIKAGSSVEMIIDENNHIVLKKFSEIFNNIWYAQTFSQIIFDTLGYANFVCDDEKILTCVGISKKEYLNAKIIMPQGRGDCFECSAQEIGLLKCTYEHLYVLPIKSEGFECGFVGIFSSNQIECSNLNNIVLLVKFLGSLFKY